MYQARKEGEGGRKRKIVLRICRVGFGGGVVASIYEPGAKGEFFFFLFWLGKGKGRAGKPGIDIFLLIWFQLVSSRSCGLKYAHWGFESGSYACWGRGVGRKT